MVATDMETTSIEVARAPGLWASIIDGKTPIDNTNSSAGAITGLP
jgi:hypothetical protein